MARQITKRRSSYLWTAEVPSSEPLFLQASIFPAPPERFALHPRLLARGEQGNIFDVRQGNTVDGSKAVNT